MTTEAIDHMARNIAKSKGMTLAEARAAVAALLAMRDRKQVQTADRLPVQSR
jgi:hypothetical protein